MSVFRKIERYFIVAVCFLIATFFAKIALEEQSTLYAFVKAIVSLSLYTYGVYIIEAFIRKEIERKFLYEEEE